MQHFLRSIWFVLAVFVIVNTAVATPVFNLIVTKTDETCPGNGTLTFTTSSTIPGSAISYAIYLLPNVTNPISLQSTSTLTGLGAGTYRIVATEATANQTTTQQQDITIISNLTTIEFEVSGTNEVCGDDGSITITINAGTASGFEIFSGPEIFPVQAGNSFWQLSAGTYQIRIFDNCGDGIVQNYTVLSTPGGLGVGPASFPETTLQNCDSIEVNNNLAATSGSVIAYPLQVQYSVNPPTGPAIPFTQIVETGAPGGIVLLQTIPFYHNQPYTYDVIITDYCGNVFTRNGNVINKQMSVLQSAVPKGCTKALLVSPTYFVAPYTVNFISAPVGFDAQLFNSSHPGPFNEAAEYFNPTIPIPSGTYTVQITDACGRIATNVFEFVNTPAVAPNGVSKFLGCDIGMSSLSLFSPSGPFLSVIVTAAPAQYGHAIPHDVSFNIAAADGKFYMNSFPAGQYTFETVDACNSTLSTDVDLAGYQILSNNINVIEKCNAFDLYLQHASNLTHSHSFWLQKLNPVTGQWGHPLTNNTGGQGFTNGNAISLINNNTTLNIAATGVFRVMKTHLYFGNGTGQFSSCPREIYNFEFMGAPRIDDIYSFACGVTSDVVVLATGAGPLIYRIIAKNGQPFSIQNGNQNLFTDLDAAVYTFQVEDGCGNILNRIFDISEPLVLTISGTDFCDGQSGVLSVPALPFLNYEWWKGSDNLNILSNSNTLQFAPFYSAAADVYHLRVTYPGANSCIDITLYYTIDPVPPAVTAGIDTTTSLCERPDIIDMYSLLGTPYDSGGIWTEVSASGTLTGSEWTTTNLPAGSYLFNYSVSNSCSSDVATVVVELKAVPVPLNIVSDTTFCAGAQILLEVASADDGTQYMWSGPNGFSAVGAMVSIDGAHADYIGTYTVSAILADCAAGPENIDINVIALPEFTVGAQCVGNAYTAKITPREDSFETSEAMYEWTGPGNFSNTDMPLNLTDASPGTYTVTVRVDGCEASKSLIVDGTACSIPQGISPNNDGLNDSLDLAGYGAVEFKIYSRYGNVVFEKSNYTNEWYGQDFKDRELPTGTYYYYVRTNTGSELTGWVYVLRD